MTCIIKIPLIKNAPVKKILNIFKINKSKERAYILDHDKDFFTLDNVLCIPYGTLGEDPQIVMDFIIFKLTALYSMPVRHAFSNNDYPCYFVNNIQTFLVNSKSETPYGIDMDNGVNVSINDAIKLRNDQLNDHVIGFVECRQDIEYDAMDESVKDAFDRADFIINEHIGKR